MALNAKAAEQMGERLKKNRKQIMEKKIIHQFFWVRTPVSLVAKNSITPDEYFDVVSIEGEFDDGSRFINRFEKPKIKGKNNN